jgi:uncharacterized phage-associated protein
MYSANVIADNFIKLASKDKLPLTHMKLQKLLYIANGIHLAKYSEPLIKESIETWAYGPVISSVYHVFKIFGSSKVTFNPIAEFTPDEKLTPEAKQSVLDAWSVGKDISGIQLSNWTHDKDSPWTKAYQNHDVVISNEDMASYFKNFIGSTV